MQTSSVHNTQISHQSLDSNQSVRPKRLAISVCILGAFAALAAIFTRREQGQCMAVTVAQLSSYAPSFLQDSSCRAIQACISGCSIQDKITLDKHLKSTNSSCHIPQILEQKDIDGVKSEIDASKRKCEEFNAKYPNAKYKMTCRDYNDYNDYSVIELFNQLVELERYEAVVP